MEPFGVGLGDGDVRVPPDGRVDELAEGFGDGEADGAESWTRSAPARV
ncbi:hypothetical protein JHN49_39850 [Streptomyces sp. MBT57]|nr:hypothetical protein [Streptomyces sp. MBT57]